MTQDKAPEWAMETAFRLVPILNGQITEQAHFIALALSQAYERGQESMRERAAGHIDRQAEAFLNRAIRQKSDVLEKHTADVLYFNSSAIRSLPIEQQKP